MNGARPVLVSIKSDWNAIADNPVIGKDVLELLSSSMYINALSIYREYLQNSADALEEANALGLLEPREAGRVDIWIDPQNRNVKIRDNGTGIARSGFTKTLIALGASRKRGSKARGFRGVGRLAGLGYCRELIFRARADGEKSVSELIWDCRRLRTALRDPSFGGTVEDLIRDVVKERQFLSADFPPRFLEVELAGIVRHRDDSLVSSEQIRNYLSQVAPVPFAPDFSLGSRIQAALRDKVALGNIRVYINGEKTPVYRPFRDTFEARKGVVDHFSDVEFFDLKGSDAGSIATGWILHHSYRGAIDPKASLKGLRLRTGNIQVGETDVLDSLFTETRFNSWCVGEIHVLDSRILPNGRRDHFEQSVHFNDLLNHLFPIAKELSRRCRVSSLRRNVMRQFEGAQDEVKHLMSVVKQGAIGAAERKRIGKSVIKELKLMEHFCDHSALGEPDRNKMLSAVKRLRTKTQNVLARESKKPTQHLRPTERRLFEQIVSLIYECSSSRPAAKVLIDRILARL